MLNGILWILRTGAPWADLPARYPSHQTCHRRFQRWVRAGALRTVLEILAQALHDEGYRRMKSLWFTPHSRSDLSGSSQRVSSATTLTNRTDWTANWRAIAWS